MCMTDSERMCHTLSTYKSLDILLRQTHTRAPIGILYPIRICFNFGCWCLILSADQMMSIRVVGICRRTFKIHIFSLLKSENGAEIIILVYNQHIFMKPRMTYLRFEGSTRMSTNLGKNICCIDRLNHCVSRKYGRSLWLTKSVQSWDAIRIMKITTVVVIHFGRWGSPFIESTLIEQCTYIIHISCLLSQPTSAPMSAHIHTHNNFISMFIELRWQSLKDFKFNLRTFY